jgi:uncharacterized membrane protein YdbT with pleckstrin-like domain
MPKGYQSNPSVFFLPNERLVLKTNPHWIFLVVPETVIFLLWIVYSLFACPFIAVLGIIGISGVCFIASSSVFLFVMIVIFLDWRFNRLYLTNIRLIKERGIIGRRYFVIFLKDIQDVGASYGILGRVFGYGDLTIESAGTFGKMKFSGIPSPVYIKWRIEVLRLSLMA